MSLDDRISEAQLEKLTLEITNLEYKNKWERGGARYFSATTTIVAVITALITVAGFWFGLLKYLHDKDQEQANTINNQFREDQEQFRNYFDQLSTFMSLDPQINAKVPLYEVPFILDQINILTMPVSCSSPEDERSGKCKRNEERKRQRNDITTTLIYFIVSPDCDFNDYKCVEFTSYVAKKWDIYKTDPEGLLKFITGKYIKAVSDFRSKAPYLTKIAYENGVYHGMQHKSEKEFQHFDGLMMGLKTHLCFLVNNSKSKEDAVEIKNAFIQRFEYAIGNHNFTQQYFGMSSEVVPCN